MGGSFPWSGSSSPWIGFGCCGRGPGEGPLDGGEGGGDRFRILKWRWISVGVVPNWSRFGNSHAGILLTDGGDVVSTCGDNGFASGFGVVAGDNIGSSLIGVVGRVVTNLRSYGDSVDLGSVGSVVGSARVKALAGLSALTRA